MFRINLENYVNHLLWPLRRKPKAVALLRALLFPVLKLTDDFQRYQFDTNYQLHATGQVISLKTNMARILNISANTILIQTTSSNNFNVLIPATSDKLREKVRAYINQHKPAATYFIIIQL